MKRQKQFFIENAFNFGTYSKGFHISTQQNILQLPPERRQVIKEKFNTIF